MDIATNIKNYRKQRKLTQKELANYLQVAPTTISAWELGRNKPLMDKVTMMADLFGVTTSDIVGDTFVLESDPITYNTKSTANVLGPVIKHIMFQRGLTIADLSKATGLSQSAISDHENQKTPLNQKDIVKYADALGVTPQFLFDMLDDAISVDILSIYNQLNIDRKQNVLSFASYQLEEQNKSSVSNVTDIREKNDRVDTIAAHRNNSSYVAEDEADINSYLDEADAKYNAKHKTNK